MSFSNNDTASLYVSQANTFLDQLRSESDRGAALVAMAYLDDMLEKLVRARMIDDNKHLNGLLDYPGPLCTASARAALAYAMGWIGPQIFKDLASVRKIRNKFGHSYEGFAFESNNAITQLCRTLKAAEFAGVRLRLYRDRFLISVKFLGLQLEELRRRSERPRIGIDPPIKPCPKPSVSRSVE